MRRIECVGRPVRFRVSEMKLGTACVNVWEEIWEESLEEPYRLSRALSLLKLRIRVSFVLHAAAAGRHRYCDWRLKPEFEPGF